MGVECLLQESPDLGKQAAAQARRESVLRRPLKPNMQSSSMPTNASTLQPHSTPLLQPTCWMLMVPSSESSSNSSGEKPPLPTAANASASADLLA